MSFLSRPTLKPTAVDPAAQDVEVPDPPDDSMSALCFAPNADYLAVASWNSQVRVYEVGQTIAGRASYSQAGPILDVCWTADGTSIISAGVDKAAHAYDLASGSSRQVAAHDAPIRSVRWLEQASLLVTASWDKTIKYWDLRASQPAASVPIAERAYAMDTCGQLLVVATAERKIQVYNLQNPTVQFGPTLESPLRFQTRSLACFPDQTGYAIGSIEGRVAIQYVDEARAKTDNFSFKCHRGNETKPGGLPDDSRPQLYSVNAISFHPQHGTFSTAGSDGTISFWDKTNKTRLKSFNLRDSNVPSDQPLPVAATAFNRTNGSMIFAYAISYDWAHGYRGNIPGHANKIKLHACKDEEVKKRPKV